MRDTKAAKYTKDGMMTDDSFVERFRPETWDEIAGQNSNVKEIRKWVEGWPNVDTTPKLLSGDPGVGKSTTAEVAAKEMGWPLMTFNASDRRTKPDVQSLAESMSGTPIDAEYAIIMLDEADSWQGQAALGTLLDQLDNPTNPIILTVNSTYHTPDSIVRRCDELKYSLRTDSIKAQLRTVAKEAGVDIDKQALGKLATRGELRSAIQDLQSAASNSPAGAPTRVHGDDIDWDERGEELPVYEAAKNIMEGTPYSGMDSTPPQLIRWLQYNIRDDFRLLEAGLAYEALSSADLQCSRVKDNDYRHWKFAGALIDQVANLRLTEPRDNTYAQSPEWVRPPKATADSAEATCYRTLNESAPFAFSGGFQEFRREHIPVLKSLPDEERYRIAASVDMPTKAMKAIDIDKDDYDDWRETVSDIDDITPTVQSDSIDIGGDSDGMGMGEPQQSPTSPRKDGSESEESQDGMDVLGDFS